MPVVAVRTRPTAVTPEIVGVAVVMAWRSLLSVSVAFTFGVFTPDVIVRFVDSRRVALSDQYSS